MPLTIAATIRNIAMEFEKETGKRLIGLTLDEDTFHACVHQLRTTKSFPPMGKSYFFLDGIRIGFELYPF